MFYNKSGQTRLSFSTLKREKIGLEKYFRQVWKFMGYLSLSK